MNSILRAMLRKLETTEADILRLRGKGRHGISEQEARALGRKITRVRQAAKVVQWISCGFIKEIRSYNPRSGRIEVVMGGGGIETFQL